MSSTGGEKRFREHGASLSNSGLNGDRAICIINQRAKSQLHDAPAQCVTSNWAHRCCQHAKHCASELTADASMLCLFRLWTLKMQSFSTWGYCFGPHINREVLVQDFRVISAVRRDDSILCAGCLIRCTLCGLALRVSEIISRCKFQAA